MRAAGLLCRSRGVERTSVPAPGWSWNRVAETVLEGGLGTTLSRSSAGYWRRFGDPDGVVLAEPRARCSTPEREFVCARYVPGTFGVPDREG